METSLTFDVHILDSYSPSSFMFFLPLWTLNTSSGFRSPGWYIYLSCFVCSLTHSLCYSDTNLLNVHFINCPPSCPRTLEPVPLGVWVTFDIPNPCSPINPSSFRPQFNVTSSGEHFPSQVSLNTLTSSLRTVNMVSDFTFVCILIELTCLFLSRWSEVLFSLCIPSTKLPHWVAIMHGYFKSF